MKVLWFYIALVVLAIPNYMIDFSAKALSSTTQPTRLAFLKPRLKTRRLALHKKVLSQLEAAEIIESVGFPKDIIPVVTCIAEKESHFKTTSENLNENNTIDYGLLQINEIWLDKCKMTVKDLKNPQKNAQCAYHVYKKQGLKAWSTYRKYKKECLVYAVAGFDSRLRLASL